MEKFTNKEFNIFINTAINTDIIYVNEYYIRNLLKISNIKSYPDIIVIKITNTRTTETIKTRCRYINCNIDPNYIEVSINTVFNLDLLEGDKIRLSL